MATKLVPHLFRERVRSARVAAGFTQQALADSLGVHRITVLGWESSRLSRMSLMMILIVTPCFLLPWMLRLATVVYQ